MAKDHDYRYIPNVISSAIANTAPPEILADVLNKRNKVHHLDSNTDEDMIPIFTNDVDGKPRNNKRLLPRRNWCSIREYHPGNYKQLIRDTMGFVLTVRIGSTPPPSESESETVTPDSVEYPPEKPRRSFSFSKGDAPPGGGLFRRFSLRGPPPTNSSTAFGDPQDRRRMSVDAYNRPPPETSDSYFPSAQSQDALPHPRSQPQSNPPASTRTPTPPRPNFHRRPTNPRRKSLAAKKQAEEDIDQGDHVNLEGGLDVTLHCEVSPSDPEGITTPYKLLVPGLWYEGGNEPNAEPVKKGLLKRMFSKKKKRVEEEDEEEDYDDDDDDDEFEEDRGEKNYPPPPPVPVSNRTPAPAPQRGFPAAANDGVDDGYGGYGGYGYDDDQDLDLDQESEGQLSDEVRYQQQQRQNNRRYQQQQHPDMYQQQQRQQYAEQRLPPQLREQQFGPDQQQHRSSAEVAQGYSGIEAYGEDKKKKRRWF